jgi:hypothetical protein
MIDGQQQLSGELLLLAGKVRLARATLPCSILLFLLLFFFLFVFFCSLMYRTITLYKKWGTASNEV